MNEMMIFRWLRMMFVSEFYSNLLVSFRWFLVMFLMNFTNFCDLYATRLLHPMRFFPMGTKRIYMRCSERGITEFETFLWFLRDEVAASREVFFVVCLLSWVRSAHIRVLVITALSNFTDFYYLHYYYFHPLFNNIPCLFTHFIWNS